MSLAVAGLVAQAPVEIQEAEIINESFPGFESVLSALGVSVAVVATEEDRRTTIVPADE